MPSRKPSGWRDTQLVVAFGSLLIVLIAIGSVVSTLVLRASEIEVWRRQMDNTSLVLAEHVTQTTASAYVVLNSIAEHIHAANIADAADLRRKMSTPEMFTLMKDKTEPLRQIDVATIVADNGDVVNFTRSFPAPAINLADRDYFIAHRDNAATDTFISAPVRNKGNGTWIFYISRRLNDAQGRFVGLAIVGLSVDGYTRFYEQIGANLGAEAAISLYRRDFTLLARWPNVDGLVGKKNLTGSTYDIVEKSHKSADVVLLSGPRFKDPDRPVRRMGAARVVERYPLIVGVTIEETFYLANWYNTVGVIAILAVGTIVIVLAGMGALIRVFRQRESAMELTLALKHEAEVANAAKSNFLAAMSHEIRTPMNAVLGVAELLRHTAMDARQQEYLNVVSSSGEALLEIIDDVLDFSKIEAGRMDLEEIPVDLRALVTGLVSIHGESARKKGLELRVSVDPALPDLVRGDPVRLRQVLRNFLSNAIKFTASGSVTLEVSAAAGSSADRCRVRFAVIDTGIGIDEVARSLLFKPFTQADGTITRRYGGTGLGLAISRRLSELMSGGVDVQSIPGKGSTFSLELPMPVVSGEAGKSVPADAAAVEVAASAGEERGRCRAHILLAEDNPINQFVAGAVLKHLGCTYEVAADGAAAVSAATAREFDLVLMDCMMPEMDGYEATRQIRRREHEESRPRLAIVALTANALSEDAAKCLQAGMDDYLPKPYSTDVLDQMIRKWSRQPLAQ